MQIIAVAVDWFLRVVVWIAMRLAITAENLRRFLPRKMRRMRGSLRKAWLRWLRAIGFVERQPSTKFYRRRTWNRTPRHVEEQVVRLHVEQPQLGMGQLRRLTERVFDFHAVRETFRKIIIRRSDLVVALEDARRRRPRRIHVAKGGVLWGADLTLVWLLGVVPVHILGVVDYHGSHLVVLERMPFRPTAAHVATALAAAIEREGAPDRLITDNDPLFKSGRFQLLLAEHHVQHKPTRVAHPWTNGRIERAFRTFKETVFQYIWLFASSCQIDRYCADFVAFYNTGRPHSSYDGLTPAEVAAGRTQKGRAIGRVSYFDGRMSWYVFES